MGQHAHAHISMHACAHTHGDRATAWVLGTNRKPAPALPPKSSHFPRPPSPAWAGPGFGAGGWGGDLQGSSSLSDEGTPAGQTDQPLGSQSSQTVSGPPTLPFPLPPGDSGAWVSSSTHAGNPDPSLLPLRHSLCHQLVYLGFLVPGKNDIEGLVVCKGKEKWGSEPG